MEQRNFKPGEFVIEALTLVNAEGDSKNIKTHCTGFTLFESIFDKFVSAELAIVDGDNLLRKYKICGQEYVRISVRGKEGVGEVSDKEFSIDKTFRVFKVSNNRRIDDKTQSYVLHLCEPRNFFIQKQRISKTFRGSYSSMILSTMKEFGSMKDTEVDFWESTLPQNVQFICPNWTVNRFIDYCVNNADRSVNAAWRNGYFFFQTINGGFRFMSVDEMFEREFPLSFNYYPKSASVDALDTPINSDGGLNSTILAYEKPQLFDTLRGQYSGAYAASTRVYNPLKKIEEEHHYDLGKTMKRGTHLSGFPMVRLDEEEITLVPENQLDPLVSPPSVPRDADFAPNKAFNSVVIEDFNMMHNYGEADDITLPEIFEGNKVIDSAKLERRALLEILQQHKVIIQIPFRTDISVGTIVKLNIPEAEIKYPEGKIKNELNDNRYLITDLKFVGNPQNLSGVINMECVKESFAKDVASYSPLETTIVGSL